MGAIAEAGVEMYVATNTTRNLSVPNLEAGVNHTFDTIDQAAMALPAFLGKNNYQTPTDPLHCPFNDAFRTTDSLFEWFPKHPEELRDFNVWMTGQREGRANWLDFFPFKKQLADGFQDGDDAVMLVDVGGAVGHEVQAIKNRYPDLPGKFVLQDLPDTLKQAVAVPGMQTMVHDFFTPQPLKGNKPAMIRAILPVPRPSSWADHLTSLHHSGARAYYLRNILHDWPDDKCRIILSQLRDAMKEGYSKIVLNELVLPVQGANLLGAYRDIAMMVCLGAMERNERQWRDLFHSVGLRVEKIWTDTPDAESIIEVVLK